MTETWSDLILRVFIVLGAVIMTLAGILVVLAWRKRE